MSTAASSQLDQRYLKLVREFPLRPLRNKRELGLAMKIAGHLATYDEGSLSSGEQDYLDALTVFIEDYQRRYPVVLPNVSPLAMLNHLMQEHQMSITELGHIVGSQSNASLIVGGKRAMSKRVILLLSKHFRVSPNVFF